MALATGRSQASNSPLATLRPGIGMPFGPGITLPAKFAWTRPPVFGSGITLPLSSIVAARSPIRDGWVRSPSWRCTDLGTNRLPSARRCRAAGAFAAAAAAPAGAAAEACLASLL